MKYRLSLIFGLAFIAKTASSATDDHTQFDAFLARFRKEQQIPALSAVIVRDGRIAWEKAYGTSDDEGDVPATLDTVFWIASVTKPIAATAILAEADAGRLSLDTLMTADPGWKETCEWLQRSKIPFGRGGRDVSGAIIPPINCQRRMTVRDMLMMRVNGDGHTFTYNPIAYARLDRVITGAQGRPLRAIVRDNILKPAGIENTALGWRDPDGGLALTRLAPPFRLTKEGPRKNVFPDDDFRAAAGLYISARNLAQFDLAFDGGKLIKPARLQQVLDGWKTDPGYAYGWFNQSWQGHRLLWHSGWEPDCYSALYLKVPEQHLSLIVLANTEGLWWHNSLVRADVERSPVAAEFLRRFVAGKESASRSENSFNPPERSLAQR